MLLLLIYCFSLNVLLAASTENLHRLNKDTDGRSISNSRLAPSLKPVYNMSYIDKHENIVRIPNLKNFYDEHKSRRKSIKKSPKSTIQKIIKKNKARRKYLNPATSSPTKVSTYVNDLDKFYAQEEALQRNENLSTTQVNQKKKKKWNTRTARYQMPFQSLAPKKDRQNYHQNKRNKRSDDRKDVFIFTNLDEIELMKNDKESSVYRAPVKKYW